ncbi:MAG: DUF2203 domain-containing protein [Planctomycetaceae bacterium]
MRIPNAGKLFTIEEANQALPLVRAIVSDIVRQYREISERKERLNQIQRARGSRPRAADPYSEELAQVEVEIESQVATLQGYVDEIEKLGVELKDPDRGLVDFRSLMDGREVYLCWHLGEDEVGYWHELEAGFAGRQSLMAGSSAGEPGRGDMSSPGD